MAPAGADLSELVPLGDIARIAGSHPSWLDAPRAAELPLVSDSPGRRSELVALLDGCPVDRAFVPARDRRAKLLLCDMDSTVITVECIDELADCAGIRAEVAAITRQAMAGEIPFEEALARRVALLAGLPVRVINDICRQRIRLQPGVRTLVRTMQAHGAFCALVSGGFSEFTRYVRLLAGFDADYANTLDIRDGLLTGRLVPPVLGARAKLETLFHLAKARGIAPADALAIGDGANDLEMIRAAGLGIAFRAHPVLRQAADAHIDHTDLTAALYFQGYRRDEFAPAGETPDELSSRSGAPRTADRPRGRRAAAATACLPAWPAARAPGSRAAMIPLPG